ncbi:hypothetical protein Pla108_06890 [Botrimarina colliarenosi]|uniref:VWFA domain-containing protein n=1 Tax=Botrimarina colliarenosi TaxID=2528001 RepID=A0A5C6AK07_9BACT|nr:VWA domain-containing protein [Botrimarina colliarenosi]TWT99746.1 hypothetical protein Pla108_06890 [Botrimarina colliarenosi]
MTPPPLIAFAFANLAILGWLAAAAAPILIHLWMRQTHRETAWAALRFLRAALERQARRLRLQHWLLLAARTLLLLLVVLAAAKPLLKSGVLGGGAPTHRVLVIDASLSMSAIDAEGQSALEQAKGLALQLVDNARAGDTHSLVVMGADAGAPLGRPTSDGGAVRRAIESIAPSQGVADLGQALATAQRLIDTAGEIGATQRQEVVFLSDLAANTWTPLAETEKNATVEAYATLAEGATLSALDVGDSSLPSVAITAASLANGLPTLAAPLEIRAEARIFDGESVERIAELLVDGAVVSEQRVTLSNDQPTPIDFVYKVDLPGVRAIAVRLADEAGAEDRLSDDNTRYVALTLRPRVRVLCVAGAPGAADYLADALDPTGEGAFEPVIVSDADLPTIDLTDFVCVFLSNVRELSSGEAERLHDYVVRGGGVAWFLGDRVSPQRYNDTLGPLRENLGAGPRSTSDLRLVSADAQPTDPAEPAEPGDNSALVPGWLSPSIAAPSYRVDPLDYKHPIVRPFQGQERSGLLNIPVMRHLPIELPESAAVSVALALENGDPLLVTGEVGRGRVAVLTTAASLDSVDPATGQAWTALPAWPSFLPIVRGMVTYLANDGGVRSLLIGEPIEGRVARGAVGQVAIEDPTGGEAGRVAPDESGAWSFRGAKRVGVYRFGPQGEPANGSVAVNPDPGESDPATVATEQLPESLTVRRVLGDVASETVAAPTPLHRWLLYGALALALIEPAMACFFGRGNG